MDKHTEKSVHGGDVYRNQVELDFSVNINPFGMPDGVKKALGDAIFLCTQYPDEKVSKLSEAMDSIWKWCIRAFCGDYPCKKAKDCTCACTVLFRL